MGLPRKRPISRHYHQGLPIGLSQSKIGAAERLFRHSAGNYAMNLRKRYLLNTNYADLSFLFTILPGEKTNAHLGTEYLAVVETDNSTPYFLNLHI